ncbi:disks large homolog 5-like isoform X2 [Peromyscus eremicus]|uniref:disks large homolog 5-like isoform X2 n=1 Tax=Peromyscus eremicus TaxID=42410 RepID=UPI0027DB37ED|nr:disks large homolog 5-like isoform X2 [Peromyscus eremicus]
MEREHREIRGRQKEDGLQSPCHTPRTARKASSTPFFLTEQEQQLNQVEKLKLQLQMMTNDRNELSEFLAHYNNELNNRLNCEHEMQNTEQKKDMSDVKKLPKEISEALYKCTELSEKTKTYRTLYSQHLSEQTQLKEKVRMLLEDKKKLQGEQILLQESCEEAKRLCEEAHEKIYDLWTRQLQEHQRLQENLQSLMKQKELLTRQRDLAVKLQHHFTVSQMRFENLQQELEQTTAQEESLLQMELLGQKHYDPAPLQKTEKAGRSQRHLEGMTFYTPGSRPPQKLPPLFSCELTSEANINLPSGDPATI